MFSLLSPISLWFGAALAVPLMIHFLGRQRMQRRPFPSLLLVKERFSKSMQRHRLKNLLLLIIRTLLILCLLLALANPALETKQAAARPDVSLALIHNGIYGGLHPNAAGDGDTADALRNQWLRLRALDSGQGGSTRAIPVIADGPGLHEVSERFGDYREAVERLLSDLGSRPGTAQARLPVFSWGDLAGCKGALLRALADDPGLQIILTDYSASAGKAAAFTGLRATPSPDAPTLLVQARLGAAAEASGPAKAQISLNGRVFQEAAAAGGRVEVTLPLGEGPRITGRFSFPVEGFASRDLYFCFPGAGGAMLAHSGSALASLPSLGRESYYRRIVHVASAKDIPWNGGASPRDGAGTGSNEKAARGGGGAGGELRLVYLSAERACPPEVYARAVEFVKAGGRLIIGVGRESDIPSLNRFLLQPLRLGRLGNLVESADSAVAKVPVRADHQALARLGRLPADLGSLGAVRKRFAFAPDSGAAILLYQGGTGDAVLAARDFHRGHALLWTTDIDDLDWTDLGVNPLTPLLHRAFQESGSEERAANVAVASDSVYTVSLDGPDGDAPGDARGPSPSGAEVRDPDGRPFTKVKADGNRLRIGPFDKLGIHRIISGKDTLAFAVNLYPPAPGAGPGAGAATAADAAGKAGEEDAARARKDFLEACKPYRGRLLVTDPADPVMVRASVRRLWPAFLLAAILLLLLEGLISATFSLRRNRP